ELDGDELRAGIGRPRVLRVRRNGDAGLRGELLRRAADREGSLRLDRAENFPGGLVNVLGHRAGSLETTDRRVRAFDVEVRLERTVRPRERRSVLRVHDFLRDGRVLIWLALRRGDDRKDGEPF